MNANMKRFDPFGVVYLFSGLCVSINISLLRSEDCCIVVKNYILHVRSTETTHLDTTATFYDQQGTLSDVSHIIRNIIRFTFRAKQWKISF